MNGFVKHLIVLATMVAGFSAHSSIRFADGYKIVEDCTLRGEQSLKEPTEFICLGNLTIEPGAKLANNGFPLHLIVSGLAVRMGRLSNGLEIDLSSPKDKNLYSDRRLIRIMAPVPAGSLQIVQQDSPEERDFLPLVEIRFGAPPSKSYAQRFALPAAGVDEKIDGQAPEFFGANYSLTPTSIVQ